LFHPVFLEDTLYTFENRGTYLLVEITEPISVKLLLSAIQEMADFCQRENLNKVLIDMRTVQEEISIIDRYTLGVNVAKVLGSKITIAVVAPDALITRVAENAAVNRYGKLKVFSDIQKALEWLGVGE
jgi:hypothetical protein